MWIKSELTMPCHFGDNSLDDDDDNDDCDGDDDDADDDDDDDDFSFIIIILGVQASYKFVSLIVNVYNL